MSSEASPTRNLFSHVTTPNPFSPDWHHQFGSKLAAFPRHLVVPLEGLNAQFWPDLATFVEGPRWRALMYYPGASRASICIVHWHQPRRWEVFRFDDDDIVATAGAASYHELMECMDALTAV